VAPRRRAHPATLPELTASGAGRPAPVRVPFRRGHSGPAYHPYRSEPMTRFCAAFAAALALGLAAPADDKKDDKKDQPLKGAWVKDVEGNELKLDFKTKSELIITVTAGDNGCTLTCKYEAD